MRVEILAVLFVVVASGKALGAGGEVCTKTDGVADGYYYGLTGSGVDRFITEFDRLADPCFDPGAIICGVRVRELYQGALPAPVMRCDLRCEDPASPGFPELAAPGLLAVADVASLGPCSTTSSTPRVFTFGGGAGIAADPLICPTSRLYASAIEPQFGPGPADFCGVLLDTNSPRQGASKVFSGGALSTIPWNHFVELIVFRSKDFDLNVRATGSSRFPGDLGAPVVYTTRPYAGLAVTDDSITISLVLDNGLPVPILRTIEVCADQSVVAPKSGLKLWNPFLTVVGAPVPVPDPVVLPAGRTVVRLEVAGAATKLKAASVVNKLVVNLPLRVFCDDPVVDVLPCVLEGVAAVDEERDVIGLRRRSGSPDDNSAEAYLRVQTPNAPGDAFNVRMRRVDLPRSVPFVMSGFEVVGGEFGGAGLPGLDAVEVRREDIVLSGSPDLSAGGLVATFGASDGIGEVPLGPPPFRLVLDFAPDVLVPVPAPGGVPGDYFVSALLLPGEISPVTAVAGDQTPDTFLGDSSMTFGGIQPARYMAQTNIMLRLLLGGDRATLDDWGAEPVESPGAHLRVGESFVPIDRRSAREE